MADRIEGADWSHWQGLVDCAKGWAKGLRFAGIKVSQGINYKDDRAEANNTSARAEGYLTYPYHFMTTDPVLTQYNWFINCIGTMKFDLAPAIDYEYYNPLTMTVCSEMNYGDFKFPYGATKLGLYLWEKSLGIVLPSEANLYTFLNKLKGWNGHSVPSVYGNVSTMNAKLINSSTRNWKQFLPWLAQWNVTIPTIPTAWKGQQLYIWQDRVISDAREWGVDGMMDHDYWMDALPFPNVPPPPISSNAYVEMLDRSTSKLYYGNLKARN